MKKIFKQLKVIDPLTGRQRVLSSEEQELMLGKGLLLSPKSIIPDAKGEKS